MMLVDLSAVVEESRTTRGPSRGPESALTEAYDDLPIDVERAICVYETVGESLVEAVRVLTGLQAYRTYLADHMSVAFAAPPSFRSGRNPLPVCIGEPSCR